MARASFHPRSRSGFRNEGERKCPRSFASSAWRGGSIPSLSTPAKQSFEDRGITKLELGNEGNNIVLAGANRGGWTTHMPHSTRMNRPQKCGSIVALVSCVKQKRNSAAPARDLYLSQLFRGLRRYAETHADAWYILSAEHGVLHPEQVVEPYERTLNTMPKRERITWAERVQQQLIELLPADAEVILLAGLRYREEIEPFLRQRGFPVSVPLAGLKIGKQLQRLKQVAE